MLAWFSLLCSGVAAAGPISNAFSAGFRGVRWTSECAPDSILPAGKWGGAGPVRYYEVVDDMPVFGVRRDRNSSIQFTCSRLGTGLAHIKIQFPGDSESYSRLMQALTEAFGSFMETSHEELPADPDDAGFESAATVEKVRWPVDEHLELQVVRATSIGVASVYVSIRRLGTNTLPGFEIRRD